MFEEAFCVQRTRSELFFILDWFYLMTDVWSGDGKGVTFLSFDSSFMWCEQFCPGRTFYFDDFYFMHCVRSLLNLPGN